MKKTPYSIAFDKFVNSDTFRKIVHGLPLGEPYLTNRFREAFDAGWNARQDSVKAKLDQIEKLIDSVCNEAELLIALKTPLDDNEPKL